MKYAVIDIGSNSVRLMLYENGVTLYKKITVTRLSQGLSQGVLAMESINRTANAVLEYYAYAEKFEGVTPLVFATEAVRAGKNRAEFLALLPFEVDILKGEVEAKIGYLGAKDSFLGRNLVIDIGGASTEIVVGDGDEIVFCRSCPVGVVRILDNCGENTEKIHAYIREIIRGYGQVPSFEKSIVIGGTGLNLVSCIRGIIPYDCKKVDKSIITKEELIAFLAVLENTPIKQRENLGVNKNRCDIIYGGGILLLGILEYIGASAVVASESDNLEGYIKLYEKQS